MDILDDMGVSKLSAKVFLKGNYSFKGVFTLGWYGSIETNSDYSLSAF